MLKKKKDWSGLLLETEPWAFHLKAIVIMTAHIPPGK